MSDAAETSVPYRLRVFGLFAGPVLAAIVLLAPRPADLTPEAQRVAAVAVLMGAW